MTERRNTRQRKLVLETVRGRQDHPTAEAVYQAVHAVDPHISRGTVYRNLNLLCEGHELYRVVMPDCDRFDLRTDPHCHLRCVVCGAVRDVDQPYRLDDDLKAALETGFDVLCHHTFFDGVCPACRRSSANSQ